jgi:hypothetical protein
VVRALLQIQAISSTKGMILTFEIKSKEMIHFAVLCMFALFFSFLMLALYLAFKPLSK